MAGLQVRLDGGRQLRAGLTNVEGGLADLKAAHKEAAGIAAAGATRYAPKVTSSLTRTIRAAGTARAGIVRAGNKKVPYAGPQNYGWSRRNIRATYFLNDGATSTEGRWIGVYQDHLTELVEKL